jgi:opacity protein-like surface antigen
MTKTWLSTIAAVALLAASSTAFAADLVRPAPAPAPFVMPVYNWTGFYIGANLGGAWANGTLTDNLTGASFSGTHSGVLGGGTLGYNWQISPSFVIGFEGTFDGTSIGNTSNIVTVPILGTPTAIQGSIGTNWVATLAARFGVAVNNVLYYAKGGGGWADNSASLTIPGASVSVSNTRSGWLAGGGIEYGLSPNWTIKAEYDYLGLSNWSNSGPLSPVDTFSISRGINMFTVGVNFKFY